MASTYDELKSIVSDYLGPAADRFLTRQIKFHLNKDTSAITASDLSKLSEWVRVSLAVLTSDKKMVDACVERINKLASETH